MSFKTIFKALTVCFILVGSQIEASGQTSVTVGQIQNGNPVLTVTAAQFNTAMATFFPGRTYSNLQLLSGTDIGGQYYYIKATAQMTTGTFPVIIVLEQSGNNINFNATDGCEMKCDWRGNCTGCDQEIIEKCKSQRCTCNQTDGSAGFGGCSSSIAFPD
jgi:hypothetical protein